MSHITLRWTKNIPPSLFFIEVGISLWWYRDRTSFHWGKYTFWAPFIKTIPLKIFQRRWCFLSFLFLWSSCWYLTDMSLHARGLIGRRGHFLRDLGKVWITRKIIPVLHTQALNLELKKRKVFYKLINTLNFM